MVRGRSQGGVREQWKKQPLGAAKSPQQIVDPPLIRGRPLVSSRPVSHRRDLVQLFCVVTGGYFCLRGHAGGCERATATCSSSYTNGGGGRGQGGGVARYCRMESAELKPSGSNRAGTSIHTFFSHRKAPPTSGLFGAPL